LTESERLLQLRYPVRLSPQTDLDEIRRRIGSLVSTVARRPGIKQGGGNKQKRIRISVALPGIGRDKFVRSLGSLDTDPMRSGFVMVWNPRVWPDSEWENFQTDVDRTEQGDFVSGSWSLGARTSGINPGDHVFLLRQHSDRGILAHGVVKDRKGPTVYKAPDFRKPSVRRNYIDIEWHRIVAPKDRLAVAELEKKIGAVNWNRIQGSGQELDPVALRDLLKLWIGHLTRVDRDEVWNDPASESAVPEEGRKKAVTSYRYERSKRARRECIAAHGHSCAVCGFSFSDLYGTHGSGFIQVHHLRPLAGGGGRNKKVDPVRDLRPVCSNCHSMLHRTADPRKPLSISELKNIIGRRRRPSRP
jgi:5-methylcytosine-specific restriction protein A